MIAGAIQMLEQGIIGDVLVAKAWNIQRRANIGKASPSEIPPGVDYDTWIGPAEFMPYQSNRFHYTWHWWHNFGTGDLGNDGAHEVDIARWGLGTSGLPDVASAIGGKYYFDDDQLTRIDNMVRDSLSPLFDYHDAPTNQTTANAVPPPDQEQPANQSKIGRQS